ncbi:hypothetical protein [Nocardiopsis coralliicola]
MALRVVDRISPTGDEPDEGPPPDEVERTEQDEDEAAEDGPDWA